MLRGPGGVLGCCGKADQLVESSRQREASSEDSWGPGCEEWMVMVVDGRAGREEGVVTVLVLELLWQQASEAEGRVGEGVELQL